MSDYILRLGQRKDFEETVRLAKANSFEVIEDEDAGMIDIIDDDIKIFRALCKGGDSWACLYHKAYFALED